MKHGADESSFGICARTILSSDATHRGGNRESNTSGDASALFATLDQTVSSLKGDVPGGSLDDRFHETGSHGTGDSFVDSSFVFDRTRSDIMARWRQVVELGMTDEEIGTLAAIARSRSEAARRVERAQILLTYRRIPRS